MKYERFKQIWDGVFSKYKTKPSWDGNSPSFKACVAYANGDKSYFER